ncbi:9635_t:CDS:2 [Gigaspora margarita]|uniref:9635_t:CDS:1 n=1 Tax=Gigaspora margarita TaxID=4874 RepID=A0ABN7V2W3_GIGMA|nr:9635_t:CDS:2 [Gigaspora margarita]
MNPFFDINNDNNDGQGNQENDFQQQIHQLLQLIAGALPQKHNYVQPGSLDEFNGIVPTTPIRWNSTAMLSTPSPVEDPIKKLTTLMGELVMMLKNDNGSRENQNRNRDNAPFRRN